MPKQDLTGAIPLYHAFKGQAEKLVLLVGRQGGNGGRRCFAAIPTGIKVGNRETFAISFLPREWAKVFDKEGRTCPYLPTSILSGWIRGYVYATKGKVPR